MLHYEQLKVLSVLNRMRKSNKPFSETEFLNQVKGFDRYRMIKLCETLKKEGYLDRLTITKTNEITAIELSYSGITYLWSILCNILKGIWAWFTTNLVGLAALTVSVIALLRTL